MMRPGRQEQTLRNYDYMIFLSPHPKDEHVYRNMNHIPFNTSDGLEQADILRVLRTHLSGCGQDGGRIACYKGGDYIRSVLIELDLFRLDLNYLKCPKWMDFEATTVWIRGEFNE